MGALLAIEWMKIKRYRTFWVLVGLFMLLLPVWNYEIASGVMKFGSDAKGGVNILSTAYSFPDVWANLGFWGSIFIIFISILVIIITTNEFQYRTHRQNIIDGWDRAAFFNAKILVVLMLSIAATLFLCLTGLAFGWSFSGSLAHAFDNFQMVGYFFLLSLNYLGLAFFLAIVVRRSGLAIGLFLLYNNIVEHILKSVLNHFSDMPIGNFLPLQASDELLPFQLMQMMKSMMPASAISSTTYALVTVGWCAVYYFAGRAILLRKDW
jgi:ABC-type transport system involved in multi-copper enzyme maturation permease subunit